MGFEKAFNFVINAEGGYVNHPKDPGGETKFGISKRTYPFLDIKNLTLDKAKELYFMDYWEKVKADALPSTIQLAVFDAAVNQGPAFAVGTLQACLGVKVDNVIGPKTLEALSKADARKLLRAYMDRRLLRYFEARNAHLFLKGWMARLLDVYDESIGGVDV